ncbi:MAG: hypothetical protein AAGH17_05935 [Pseudomonadota bacterium]
MSDVSEKPKRKFGPTKGEYQFRLVSGLVIVGLIGFAMVSKGMPKGLVTSESILFGGLFALFLIGHSGWKLLKGDYRT